jgi:hypothetical protein
MQLVLGSDANPEVPCRTAAWQRQGESVGDACPRQTLRELLHLNGHNVQVRARGTLGGSLAASLARCERAASPLPRASNSHLPERVPGAGTKIHGQGLPDAICEDRHSFDR